LLLFIFILFCINTNNKISNITYNCYKNFDLTLKDKNNKEFKINKTFLEWLVGFTDAEGNFTIILRDNPKVRNNILLKGRKRSNVSKYVNLTFQIGLHVADLSTLKFIQKELRCGNISVSKNKCNYYVSNYDSIINIIIPLFNYFHLNSTKYSQFIKFKEAADIIYNKSHLTYEGLSKLSNLKDIINISPYSPELINITDNWILGFIEGDATFSTGSIYRPRLKFENHIKEEKLFIKLQEYFGKGKVRKFERIRHITEKSVILDISDIYYFKLILIPLFRNLKFYTKKYLDFCYWSYIVDLYYLGFHLTLEGKSLIKEIKSLMNKKSLINSKENLQIDEISIKVINLLDKPSPYVIINGKRHKRKYK